jgi:hypothetical protein
MNITTSLMSRNDGRPFAWVSLCVAALAAGCGSGTGQSPHPVQPDLARNTLQEVLQSWKDGETIDSWREHDPQVVVQDLDWMAGRKLQNFEILDGDEAVDANLHCQVRLTLNDPDARQAEQTVTYLVTTSPKLTVFREIIP